MVHTDETWIADEVGLVNGLRDVGIYKSTKDSCGDCAEAYDGDSEGGGECWLIGPGAIRSRATGRRIGAARGKGAIGIHWKWNDVGAVCLGVFSADVNVGVMDSAAMML